MLFFLLLHAAMALVTWVAGRRLGTRVVLLAAVAPGATFVWLLTNASHVLDGGTRSEHVEWLPALDLAFDLRLDGFAFLMAMLVSGVGTAIFVYSRAYFGDRSDLGGFAALMTAFAGSMLGVVLADNLLVLYVFWELTSVTSFLLIGFTHHQGSTRAAALQALLVTGAGGLAMLAGFVLLGQAAGTYSLSAIVAAPPEGQYLGAAAVLVLLGAFTKSAQAPFHAWLPGAMAAPTPVSAYLHSATLVKAGVYLIARLAPVLAVAVGWWRPAVVGVGALTMLIGGYRALRQHDLKLLLAFGTVSQLGFMVLLVGAGEPDLTFAGAALILAHGLFKAVLFMAVGIIDHVTGTRDLRHLSGLGRRMPALFVVSAIGVASMAGLPALVGFLAKEAAYEALLHSGGGLVTAAVVAGSVLTFAYGARFLWGAFATKPALVERTEEAAEPAPALKPLSATFLAPAVVLAALTLVLGLLPEIGTAIARAGARTLDVRVAEPKLLLWHGFTAALGLSALTVVTGALLFLRRHRVEALQGARKGLPSAHGAYEAMVKGLNRTADRTTGTVQNGSLPVYIGVILLTVLALPGSALFLGNGIPSGIDLAESPLQVAVAALVVVAAIGTALAGRRFVAVLLLGAVGFGVAVLFLLQGAPDLALTQLLVETLVLVIFVLVLRHLPDRFDRTRWKLGQGLRLAVAGSVGLFVMFFSLVAAGARREAPISTELVERALPEGGGRNVVNVILTDFRAFDTLGEITVLVVAALGIASLVAAARRSRTQESVEGDAG